MSETNWAIAKQRIAEARRTQAVTLSLNQLDLTTVPADVWELHSLQTLWLNGNALTDLPSDISRLSQLQQLGLGSNKFAILPIDICSIKRLHTLALDWNSLSSLPLELSNLQNLRKLVLTGNPLGGIPPGILGLSNLKHLRLDQIGLSKDLDQLGNLRSLEVLEIASNSISSLPPSFFSLTNLLVLSAHSNRILCLPAEIGHLTHLHQLSLNINRLRSLPPEIGCLTSLRTLLLNKNQLERLPPEIGKLTALKVLNLRGNRLVTLPPEVGELRMLREMPLRGNEFVTLPKEFGRIERINSVSLSAPEKLAFPPADLASLGGNAIVRYLRAADMGEETVLESKLLLVGEGNVGKTWLYEALNGRTNGGNKAGRGATIGIEIGPLLLDQTPSGDNQMRLNCWDFAGQDITHATHQFFFSERSLFVVCWNARAGWESGKLRKWLTNIRDRAPGAKVLLVATHADEQHSDYPEKELRGDFTQIVGTFKVSNKTGDGIGTLVAAIAREAKNLPMMGLRWPKSWRAAEQAVLLLRLKQPFVSVRETYETMASSGIDKHDAVVLLRWLHELGEVLHYADVPELAEVVMLDPQWVTQHVGTVLASAEIQDARGILTRQCLSRLWPDIDDHVRQHLLAMMERFDLAYRIPDSPDNRCLVVERLQQDTADYEPTWDAFIGHPEVRLRYKLKSMHPGIPTWFIARCHRFTLGLHWLRGVLFGDARKSPRHLALMGLREKSDTGKERHLWIKPL